MADSALVLALRRQREKSVDLGDGKKVTFLRPPEVELTKLLHGEGDTRTWVVGIDEVRAYVVGWSGFTEADILGAAVGSSDPLQFDQALWAELVGDKIEWMRKVADAILKSVVDHINRQAEVAKNSEPA